MVESQDRDRVVEFWEKSQALGRKKRFFVVVPESSEPRPVCYLLHGWGGNASSYLSHPRIRELLLAAPFNTVSPESFRRWFINDIAGRRYEDYLVNDLVPLIDRNFASHDVREGRAIGGFSWADALPSSQRLAIP